MKTYTKDVFKIDEKDEYILVWTKDQKGEHKTRVYDDKIKAQFSGPGKYEIDFEKNDEGYWVIKAARKSSGGATSGGSNSNGPSANPEMELYRNRAITAQVAIKAAADATSGVFQGKDPEAASKFFEDILDLGLAKADIFLAPKAKAKPAERRDEDQEEAPF